MDYRLASAMRGPDCTEGGDEWKGFVISPLRWFAATLLNMNPWAWSLGYVQRPSTVLAQLAADVVWAETIESAATFAASSAARHIREHAREAFEYLLTTSQKDAAKELYEKLRELRLL